VNNSANSNIFEVTARDTLELYGDFVEGLGSELVLVLCGQAKGPGSQAKRALISSMEKLGYGMRPCAFATCELADGGQLGPSDAFTLVEGLDPLLVVAVDAAAARLLSQAYRVLIQPDGVFRLMGRPCLAFSSFEHMLATEDERQRAWALMKSVARSTR